MSSPTYSAGWKDVDRTVTEDIPIMALLTDKKLQTNANFINNPMYESLLNLWNRVMQICSLENLSWILRWCAYNSDFKPNALDKRFKSWVSKGLTSYYTFVHRGAFMSFEFLQNKYGLGQDDFYRYLQVRHYFDQNIKASWDESNLGFFKTFQTLKHFLKRK